MIKTKKSIHDKEQSPESHLTWKSKALQKEWKQFWEMNKHIPSAYAYNLTICDAPKFIWFRNAKVATRSIFGAIDAAGVKLTAVQAFHCYYPPQEYNDYFKFAFVRNPWDRFVSGWLNKVVKLNALNFDLKTLAEMQQFDRFVEYYSGLDLDTCDHHFRRQCRLIDLNEVDYIGRLEHFDEDLKEVFRILALPEVTIPHKNRSQKQVNYHSYYTDDTRRMIEKMYQKDIRIFGYTF